MKHLVFMLLFTLPTFASAIDCKKEADVTVSERFHCTKVLSVKNLDKVTYKVIGADLCISKNITNNAISLEGELKMRRVVPIRGGSRVKTYNIFHHVNKFNGSKKEETGYYMEYDERIFINNIIGDIIYEESRFNATYNRINGNLDIEEYETEYISLKYSIAATLGCKQYKP